MSEQGDLDPAFKSLLGTFREADLVILEFAVNDVQASLGMSTLPSDLYTMLQTPVLSCMEAVIQQLFLHGKVC